MLNRAKRPECAGKVLFVDAAQAGYFRPGKAQNYLDPEHISKIVAAYEAFEDAPGFAHVADVAEIEGNDYNLNISRYVAPVVEEEQVDIAEVLARLREAERERDEAAKRMDELLAELGYAR